MRVELHPCYVLHRRPYRETSLLLEVLSCAHGRVGLVGRGAARRSAGWGGLLQPFRPLQLAWSQRGELGTLTGVEPDEGDQTLTPARMASGFYLNEILVRLLERNDPCPQLFACYAAALREVARAESEEPALRLFEKHLLAELGYALLLEATADTGQAIACDRTYHYVVEHGPCEHLPQGVASLPLSGATLEALAQERIETPECRREAKQLMRFVLARYLGERPLESRRLLATR